MTAAPTTGALLLATAAVLVMPGPSVVFVVTKAVTHGRAAGLLCVIGLEVGLLVHVTLATVGIGALLASSASALTALRTAGVVYLVWLGLRQITAAPALTPVTSTTRRTRHDRWTLARDAFVVDLLNPQTVLLLLALLPQIAGRDTTAGSLMLWGLGVVGIAVVCDVAWVLAGTSRLVHLWVATRLPSDGEGSRRGGLVRRVVSGAVYLGLAGWAWIG